MQTLTTTLSIALALALATQPLLAAQDGNDLLIVNNGDGSDFLEGLPSATFDVEIGLVPKSENSVFIVIYGNRDASPVGLVAKGDRSAIVGDFDRDGYADLALVQEIDLLEDVTGDGTPDLITAPGPGGGPHVFVLSPYGGFMGGVRVATGDVTGDGRADIIVAADAGHVPATAVPFHRVISNTIYGDTTSIDAGAVFKLQDANLDAGR